MGPRPEEIMGFQGSGCGRERRGWHMWLEGKLRVLESRVSDAFGVFLQVLEVRMVWSWCVMSEKFETIFWFRNLEVWIIFMLGLHERIYGITGSAFFNYFLRLITEIRKDFICRILWKIKVFTPDFWNCTFPKFCFPGNTDQPERIFECTPRLELHWIACLDFFCCFSTKTASTWDCLNIQKLQEQLETEGTCY